MNDTGEGELLSLRDYRDSKKGTLFARKKKKSIIFIEGYWNPSRGGCDRRGATLEMGST